MDKIFDARGAKDWAKSQPVEKRSYVGARAALRAFPAIFLCRDAAYANDPDAFNMREVIALPTLFGLALSSAAAARDTQGAVKTGQELDIVSAALEHWSGEAASGFDPATADGDRAAEQAMTATLDAVSGVLESFRRASGTAVSNSARAISKAVSVLAERAGCPPDEIDARAEAASSVIYAAATNDANDPEQDWPPLWSSDLPALPELLDLWEVGKAHFGKEPETWGFWVDWYEGLLNGRQPSWPVTLRIATGIESGEWEPVGGAALAARRIARITR
ncbi:hypothetical protein [Nioella sp. MMSF_3534]|uniref:hypothetical protein n=1 Tax=Nioella sp. MMSF_3534 TaxID=3046720 RepID=UPI00273EC071|nr:hypothetical protein [Nioella sp. MMSF_3534]